MKALDNFFIIGASFFLPKLFRVKVIESISGGRHLFVENYCQLADSETSSVTNLLCRLSPAFRYSLCNRSAVRYDTVTK